MQYALPQFGLDAFNCPYCLAYSEQTWGYDCSAFYKERQADGSLIRKGFSLSPYSFSKCRRCFSIAVWNSDVLIYPYSRIAPMPNEDMPKEIQKDYMEAREIATASPRGASALLRLALQKLCESLGKKGDINTMIGALVKDGLPEKIQQALDIIRVTGNNAVHPGEMNIDDTPEVANALFIYLNIITDYLITQQKNIDVAFQSLPAGAKQGIEKRDKLKP